MKKNILVVDDSALMRRVICDIINTDNEFEAAGVAKDGLDAYEKIKAQKYDGILLDVNMPRMNGLELLERLQKERIRATVVMVSTLTTKDAEVTIRALELGAVDFVTKPSNIVQANGGEFKQNLLSIMKAVIKSSNASRLFMTPPKPRPSAVKPAKPSAAAAYPLSKGGKKLVALACSTGGPKALQSVIPFLPKNMDAPMILVQHMPNGFTKTMAARLNEVSPIEVRECKEGDVLKKGLVLVAQGGKHMEIVPCPDGTHKVHLDDSPPVGGLKPYANFTYKSLRSSTFDEIVCVVLTGMGADGTEGIVALNAKKKLHVIAQDAESCVVYGMPKAIADTGLVDEVVPLNDVAQSIIKHVGVK